MAGVEASRTTLHLILMPSHIRDSGAATAGLAFARAAARLDDCDDHSIIVPPQYAEWAPEARVWKRSRAMQWVFDRLPESIEFVFSGRRMLAEFRRTRPTHVHIHHLIPSLDFLRACLYGRLLGASVTWSSHGLVEIVTPRQTYGISRFQATIWHVLIRLPIAVGAQLCHLIIVGADRDERWLKKIAAAHKASLVVPNGSKFEMAGNQPKAVPSDPPVLLFVGAHVHSKGLGVLFESLNAVRGAFEMRVVGAQREDIDYSLAEQVNQNESATQSVTFLGRISDEELFEQYLQADLFVLPSLSDTQPLVLIDALATGTPVVATDVGSVRDIVDSSVGQIVEPGSVVAMTSALDELLCDISSLTRLTAAAGEAAGTHQWSTAASAVRERLIEAETPGLHNSPGDP